jgi:hypothetical protein
MLVPRPSSRLCTRAPASRSCGHGRATCCPWRATAREYFGANLASPPPRRRRSGAQASPWQRCRRQGDCNTLFPIRCVQSGRSFSCVRRPLCVRASEARKGSTPDCTPLSLRLTAGSFRRFLLPPNRRGGEGKLCQYGWHRLTRHKATSGGIGVVASFRLQPLALGASPDREVGADGDERLSGESLRERRVRRCLVRGYVWWG